MSDHSPDHGPTVAERLIDQESAALGPPARSRHATSRLKAYGLVKHFGEIKAVNGIDLRVRSRADLRLPRPERQRQDHNRPHADHAPASRPPAMRPTWQDSMSSTQDRQVRRAIGVALQEAGLDILQTGRELLRLQSRLYNVPRGEIESSHRASARRRRPDRGRRPPDRRLFRRHAAAPRPRLRPRPFALDHLP